LIFTFSRAVIAVSAVFILSAQDPSGLEMLHRAQQALGGADKLAAIKDFTQTLSVAMDAGASGVTVTQRNRYLAPGTYRQDEELPFGRIISYTDGSSGWRSTPRGAAAMSPVVLKQAQDEVFRNLYRLMLADRDPDVKVNALGPRTFEIARSDGLSIKVELEESTGLPFRKTYTTTGARGASASIEELYEDWRVVDGLKVPFKITVQQNGKKLAEDAVQEFKFNSDLKTEELSRRP
jgi:hypothetical protein